MYRKRYWNETYFKAIETIKPAAEKHGLGLSEVALRWLMHHSELSNERGDAVIIGASSKNHIEGNLVAFEKGALPEDVVKAVDEAWRWSSLMLLLTTTEEIHLDSRSLQHTLEWNKDSSHTATVCIIAGCVVSMVSIV